MDALFGSVDHKHSEAVAEGGHHHKLDHPKIVVHLGNTNSGKSGGYGSSGGGSKSGHPGNPAGPHHHHDDSTHGPGSAGSKTVDHDNSKNPLHVPEKSGNPVIGTPDTHHPDVNNGNREVRNGLPLIGTPVTHQPNGTPPGHGGLRPVLKPTPGHGGPKNGLPVIGGHHHGNYREGIINTGHIVAGHHPEGMMRCARCSCIYTECQCGKSRQVGEAYCPNPNTMDVLKEFKTIVQIYRKIPEMKTVEKLTHKKKVITEERKFFFERDVIYYEDVERVELIPVIKEVPRTIKEFVYEIITTEVEVPYTELVVDYREDCIIDETPIFKTMQVPETISVPVVIDKEVTRMCEEPTGQWCEVPVEDFCTRGDFNLICDDEAHDHSSSSDSSDSDSSHAHRHRHHTHTNGGRYNDSPKSATKSKNLKSRSEKEKTRV